MPAAPAEAEDLSSAHREISATTIAQYRAMATSYHQGWNHDVTQNIQALLAAIPGVPPYRILDLGCGRGVTSGPFATSATWPAGQRQRLCGGRSLLPTARQAAVPAAVARNTLAQVSIARSTQPSLKARRVVRTWCDACDGSHPQVRTRIGLQT
jgi:hypothetical protein